MLTVRELIMWASARQNSTRARLNWKQEGVRRSKHGKGVLCMNTPCERMTHDHFSGVNLLQEKANTNALVLLERTSHQFVTSLLEGGSREKIVGLSLGSMRISQLTYHHVSATLEDFVSRYEAYFCIDGEPVVFLRSGYVIPEMNPF